VTSHIISLLEDDIIPWRKPFNVSTSPINGASKHEYSGVNAWLLRLLNFDEPFFFGFKQINDEMDGLIKAEKLVFLLDFHGFITEIKKLEKIYPLQKQRN